MSRVLALVVLVPALCLALASTSAAEKPIKGYTYCGAKDFETGGWTYDPPPGAYLYAYARGMSCQAARRNVSRVRHSRTPPYRPSRTGYRCREVRSAHEYSSVRCVRRGDGRKAFRLITGA
jgi:hypothetical protein